MTARYRGLNHPNTQRCVGIFGCFVVLLFSSPAGGAWLFVPSNAVQGLRRAEQFVELPTGAGSGSMGRRLVDAGVVRSADCIPRRCVAARQVRRLQAGEYRFDRR